MISPVGKKMKMIAHSNESLVAGIAAGASSFFVITGVGDSPIWLRLVVAVLVLSLVHMFGRRRYRAISTDGETLSITDGAAVRRFSKSDIQFYQITKTTDYQLKVVLKNRDAVIFPLHGIFSERSVRKVFESLGVGQQLT